MILKSTHTYKRSSSWRHRSGLKPWGQRNSESGLYWIPDPARKTMIDLDLNSKNSIWREVLLITCSILALPYSEALWEQHQGVRVYFWGWDMGNVQSEEEINEQSQDNLIQSSQELRVGWKFMFQHDREPKHSRDNAGVRHHCQRCPWVTQTQRWLKLPLPSLERPDKCSSNNSPHTSRQRMTGSAKKHCMLYPQVQICSVWNEMNRNGRKRFWLHWTPGEYRLKFSIKYIKYRPCMDTSSIIFGSDAMGLPMLSLYVSWSEVSFI